MPSLGRNLVPIKICELKIFIPLRENPGHKPAGKRSVFASEGFRSRRSGGEETPTVRLGELHCSTKVI